jgi:hypothetical protein
MLLIVRVAIEITHEEDYEDREHNVRDLENNVVERWSEKAFGAVAAEKDNEIKNMRFERDPVTGAAANHAPEENENRRKV